MVTGVDSLRTLSLTVTLPLLCCPPGRRSLFRGMLGSSGRTKKAARAIAAATSIPASS